VYLLTSLGGLALSRPDGTPAVDDSAQRRLVLLALVVEAGPRGLPRDRAIALLWPEADEERGRRSLNQLRYTLRRDLGIDPLVGTLSLRPDPAVLGSDLADFRAALEAGDADRASRLLSGPFLDGVPFAGGAELEEWVEGCRVACRRGLERLLERTARAATEQHDDRVAEGLWRRLVTLDPLNAIYTVGLMETLNAGGDATGALVAAAEHESVVRRELGVSPDASVAALAASIRQGTRPTRAPGPSVLGGAPAPIAVSGVTAEPAIPPAPPADLTPAMPAPDRRAPGDHRVRNALILLGCVAASVGMGLALRGSRPPTAGSTLAVLPFTVRGAAAYQYLGEGMVTLLTAKLDGAGVLRPVDGRAVLSAAKHTPGALEDPARAARIADRLGAGLYVLGDIVEGGGRLRLTVSAYRTGHPETIAEARVEGNPADLFTLVDSLAGALLAGLGSGHDARLTRLAASTTGSLEALKAYLEGQKLFREGRFLAAEEAFGRAAADTSFALASYWLSVSGWWADQSDVILPAADRAVRQGGKLAERDRLLLQAWDTLLHGDAGESERLYRAVLGVEPENVHAVTQLGEVLFHYSPRRGGSPAAARPAFERVVQLEPGDPGALLHLARIAAMENRLADVRRLLDDLIRSDSSGEYALEARTLRAFASHDSREEAGVLLLLSRASDGRIWNEALYAWMSARNRDGARRIIRLLTDPSRAPEVRGFGHIALAYMNLADGKVDAARSELDQAARFDSVAALEHRALILAMPFLPADSVELERVRDRLRRWNALAPIRIGASHVGGVHDDAHPVLRAYLLGQVSVRLGDLSETRHQAEELGRMPGPTDLREYAREAAASLRAQALLAQGHDREGAAMLRQSLRAETRISRMGASPFYSRGLERFLLAGALVRLGESTEAARWYDSFTCQPLFDQVYLAPAERASAAPPGRDRPGGG
jgi:DNA-binding SARP family transcriptional activator/tetratricopeptide (TPR) repeat protein